MKTGIDLIKKERDSSDFHKSYDSYYKNDLIQTAANLMYTLTIKNDNSQIMRALIRAGALITLALDLELRKNQNIVESKELWIARDLNNQLFIFYNKPVRAIDNFCCASGTTGEDVCQINSEWFPEITFKNSPRKVSIELI